MLVDLHAHFPMHIPMDGQTRTHDHVRAAARRRWQAWFVNLISRFANYQGPGDTPSVTGDLMRAGQVGVALSVLYTPLNEMDLGQPYGAAPAQGYFADVLAELQAVEDYASTGDENVVIAHSPAELDELIAGPRPVLIHCIEGGFQLGHDDRQVREHVKTLRQRGVAYVTLAHLFWREVATNAPALPFLPDWLYHLAFPQPDRGLTDLGRTAVRAMVEHGILVDITHMSARSAQDTFALLDDLDPGHRVPVLATHMACRLGKLEYCLADETIRQVAERGGVLGCILCEHYISSGRPAPVRTYEDSVAALCAHIDRVREVTGSDDHIAIGSDLDGYIKPALPGLEHHGRMRALQESLSARYGPRERREDLQRQRAAGAASRLAGGADIAPRRATAGAAAADRALRRVRSSGQPAGPAHRRRRRPQQQHQPGDREHRGDLPLAADGAQLAAEPLVDRAELVGALGVEGAPAGDLGDLLHQLRIGRDRDRRPERVGVGQHAAGRAERDRVDRDPVARRLPGRR